MDANISRIRAIWNFAKSLISNPWGAAKSASPVVMVLGIVFIIQPIVSGIIGLLGDYSWIRSQVDPNKRAVTVAEFKLLDNQVDAVQSTLVTVGKKVDALQASMDQKQKHSAIPRAPVTPDVYPETIVAQTAPPVAASVENPKIVIMGHVSVGSGDSADTVAVPPEMAPHVAAYETAKSKLVALQDKLNYEYTQKKPKL